MYSGPSAQQNAKLQAMIMGLGQGAQAPAMGPPTAAQPGGFPQMRDPIAPVLAILAKDLRRAADYARQHGDESCAVYLDEMSVDLQRKVMERSKSLAKIQNEKMRLTGEAALAAPN